MDGGVATPAPPWQRALRRLATALAELLGAPWVLDAFDALADRLGVAAALARGRVVALEPSGRRLAVGRVIGEGGYATVYLVRDADADAGQGKVGRRRQQQQQQQRRRPFALKRVADGGSVAAQREEAALRDVRGCPGVAELLEACRAGRGGDPAAGGGGGGAGPASAIGGSGGGGADAPLLLLFPAYAGGTLQEALDRRRRQQEHKQQQQKQQRPLQAPLPSTRAIHVPHLLPARGVLAVAAQVAAALSHVHARGWVHRDVKPHNVMLVEAVGADGEGGDGGGFGGFGGGAGGGRGRFSGSRAPGAGGGGGQSLALFSARRRRAGGYGRVTGSDDDDDEDDENGGGGGDEEEGAVELAPMRGAAAAAAATAAAAGGATTNATERQDANGGDNNDHACPHLLRPRVVLIDFGSAARWPIAVRTRQDARLLQEEAEAHVTATYRAPELFDLPPPPCEVGPAVDVWALGCVLFACMHGAPPFEPQAGGSVALAALAGRVPWPAAPPCYPPALVELVRSCLATDPARRPSAAHVAQRARELLLAGFGDDDDQAAAGPTGGGGGGGGGSAV